MTPRQKMRHCHDVMRMKLTDAQRRGESREGFDRRIADDMSELASNIIKHSRELRGAVEAEPEAAS